MKAAFPSIVKIAQMTRENQRMRHLRFCTLCTAAAAWLFAINPSANGQIAADNASDLAYAGGWADGSNGGFGFQPWQILGLGNTAHYIGDSNSNGFGGGPGINTPVDRAWGLKAAA